MAVFLFPEAGLPKNAGDVYGCGVSKTDRPLVLRGLRSGFGPGFIRVARRASILTVLLQIRHLFVTNPLESGGV